MSIIELKISINSHCANIDPKIFFMCALHTFLVQILVIPKKLRDKRQFERVVIRKLNSSEVDPA